jgi:hypothetical protein
MKRLKTTFEDFLFVLAPGFYSTSSLLSVDAFAWFMLDSVRFGCHTRLLQRSDSWENLLALRHPPTFSDCMQFEIGRRFGFYFKSTWADAEACQRRGLFE